MSDEFKEPLWHLLGFRFKSHPWHGVSFGPDAPHIVTAYIEVTPHDTVKYEIDKATGYLKIDRPQKFSNTFPALYGFIPKTYCDVLVAEHSNKILGRTDIVGDRDPIDICVLSERDITQGDILLQAIPIGGFRMIDGGEADDKIIAVLKDDAVYGQWTDILEMPKELLNRFEHYFLTYKEIPGSNLKKKVEITHTYGREEAIIVINKSIEDYKAKYGDLEEVLTSTLRIEQFKKS